MAGSLNHIVDEETGRFTMDLIGNLGDAYEALGECFHIIHDMTGGKASEINQYLQARNYPEIQRDMEEK